MRPVPLILGTVIVHLDYTNNGLFAGLPNVDIKRLQGIQTMAAQIVLGRSTIDSATQCFKELHWLPIQLRIYYKILLTVYKCLSNQAPTLLSMLQIVTPTLLSMLQRQTITRTTRTSQDQTRLVVPRTTKKIFADRSFSVVGPTL